MSLSRDMMTKSINWQLTANDKSTLLFALSQTSNFVIQSPINQLQQTEGLMMSRCKYCGINATAGGSCSKSPTKHHVVEIPGKCIYCGITATAGGTCSKSPHKYHEVNAGPKRCIYCGVMASAGGNCSKSPSRGHVLGT